MKQIQKKLRPTKATKPSNDVDRRSPSGGKEHKN